MDSKHAVGRTSRIAAAAVAATLLVAVVVPPVAARDLAGPGFEPPPFLQQGRVRGTVSLRPARGDYSWCSFVRVTARLRDLESGFQCAGEGITRDCWPVSRVVSESTVTVAAMPRNFERSRWSYEIQAEAADEVTLSARCEPGYDYRFKSRGKGTGRHGFVLRAGETVNRNLKLAVSVPAEREVTLALSPAVARTNWERHEQEPTFGTCVLGTTVDAPGRLVVGHWSRRGTSCGDSQTVHQAVMRFDLAEITALGTVFVLAADLDYGETPFKQLAPDGQGLSAFACATRLGRATIDGTGVYGGLVSYEDLGAPYERPSLASTVSGWLAFPETNEGLVLAGDGDFPRDDSACLSDVTSPTLNVRLLVVPKVPVRF